MDIGGDAAILLKYYGTSSMTDVILQRGVVLRLAAPAVKALGKASLAYYKCPAEAAPYKCRRLRCYVRSVSTFNDIPTAP